MGMYGWVNTPNHSEDGVELYEDIVPSRKDKRSIEVSMISSAMFYLEKMYLYIEKGVSLGLTGCSQKIFNFLSPLSISVTTTVGPTPVIS